MHETFKIDEVRTKAPLIFTNQPSELHFTMSYFPTSNDKIRFTCSCIKYTLQLPLHVERHKFIIQEMRWKIAAGKTEKAT
jgi:hypothetical protein